MCASIYDKMHSKLNKKRLKTMLKNFDMVDMSQVGNLVEVSRDFRDIIREQCKRRQT